MKAIERKHSCVIPWVFVHPDGRRIKDFRALGRRHVKLPAYPAGWFMISVALQSETSSAPAFRGARP